MNKRKKMMLALMAGAMAFTACNSDDNIEDIEINEVAQDTPQLKPMTFTAVQEGQGGTRAAIDGLDINWSDGDYISVFDGSTMPGDFHTFKIETGAGSTSATFTGSAADASTYYALYPGPRFVNEIEFEAAAAGIDNRIYWKEALQNISDQSTINFYLSNILEQLQYAGKSDEEIRVVFAYIQNQHYDFLPDLQLAGSSIKNVVIPAVQEARPNSADPAAMIMIAKSDDTKSLNFKNVCAYVKVTPQFDCYAIGLTSNGSEQIAGKVTINYNDGDPTTTVTADGTNSVSLIGNITAGNTYYIAVRPEALTTGFSIEFLTKDKEHYYARSTDKSLDLTRSNVKNLGEFSTTGTWTISTPTFGDDGAGHDWKLLAPTFKIATCYDVKEEFENCTPWTNWAFPEADELFDLAEMGCITSREENSTPIIKLHGMGILKYVSDVEFKLLPTYYIDFWTQTPGTKEPYSWKYVRIGDPNSIGENTKWYRLYAIYKYNN